MKCLIVEDDFTARKLLQAHLCGFGECYIATDGREAVEAVRDALTVGKPYDLICLDIMMPQMDGHDALEAIRKTEKEHGVEGLDCAKVIMTTALSDPKNVMGAFREGCEAYIVKPVQKNKLLAEMEKLGVIEPQATE